MIKLIKSLFKKLFMVNDTPHKIALGLGIGVFSGVLPGTGPIAAITMALILRANRAAALASMFLTNTWLSLIIFVLSIKIGSFILGLNFEAVRQGWQELLKSFTWKGLFNASFLKIVFPVLIGYAVLSLTAGILTYFVARFILYLRAAKKAANPA